jgi:hypothetical protein
MKSFLKELQGSYHIQNIAFNGEIYVGAPLPTMNIDETFLYYVSRHDKQGSYVYNLNAFDIKNQC